MTVLANTATEAVASQRELHADPPIRISTGSPWLLLGLDTVAVTVAVVLTGLVTPGRQLSHAFAVFGIAAGWLAALGMVGSYRTGLRRPVEVLRPLVSALGWTTVATALPALLLSDALRRTVADELLALLVCTGLLRLVFTMSLDRRRPRRVVLVGAADVVRRAAEKLTGGRRGRYVELVHTHVPTSPTSTLIPSQRGLPGVSAPTRGTLDALLQAVDATDADTVLLCPGAALGDDDARRLVWALADRDVELALSTSSFGAHTSRVQATEVGGVDAVSLSRPQLSGPAKVVKSVLERTAAALGVLVLSPLLAAIALAIRCTSSGPALFRQARTGLNGRTFVVYKFRTMRQGSAEQFLELAEKAGQSSMFFKLESDPRITRFGSFLRKTSLDELPQLFNVVLGNMSLIGPRPLPAEVDQSNPDVARRLRALPGITGQWQVSGRSTVKGDAAVEHDIDYVDNWRLGLDVSILRRTVRAVMRSDGAY